MLAILPETTVGQLVREVPARARVFEALEIDYCCGGKMSLAQACDKRGVDTADLLQRIAAVDIDSQARASLIDADSLSLTELIDHIEQKHHAYLRTELPRLDQMTEKVARVHGDKEPRLRTLRKAFVALRAELEPHMFKEERILFPMIREMEKSSTTRQSSHCGTIANPIQQMEHEHQNAGDSLATIREATDGFVPPAWACNTYRAMLDGLEQLESDMHQHVHKENNVLFPKAIQLENS